MLSRFSRRLLPDHECLRCDSRTEKKPSTVCGTSALGLLTIFRLKRASGVCGGFTGKDFSCFAKDRAKQNRTGVKGAKE